MRITALERVVGDQEQEIARLSITNDTLSSANSRLEQSQAEAAQLESDVACKDQNLASRRSPTTSIRTNNGRLSWNGFSGLRKQEVGISQPEGVVASSRRRD